ncbi:MAG: YhcH/YjgK/YiaL family protein [Cetobacterium sp.]|uniref:YhcH/YjgK/YiaL family protein n=1 Tax=unclassified Cetobacterium TaxID=2630983 RepID=UPI00163B7DB4|nr:YhcH/YjgK/YiaL family protein [Cetobacterium sp. 2A]MBC2855689.1 YhcH/YjgK/YiaL family protein [Cetobacterium sp. 2A]
MIFGKMNELKFYKGMSSSLDKAIEVIESGEYLNGKVGKNEIDGDNLFFNIQEIDTKLEKDCFFETHKKYADIHVLIEGNESIGYSLEEELEADLPYDSEKDFAALKGEPKQIFEMKNDRFIIFFPDEPHMPIMATEKPEKIKKAIFKIKY